MATLQVAINARRAEQGAKQFDRAARQVERSATHAASGVRRLDAATEKSGSTTQRAVLALGRYKTLIAGLGVYGAARTMASFEEAMAKVRGVTGGSADEFERLLSRARDIGATTRFSATDAANGLLFLARAGYSVRQSLEAVDAVMTLAAASGMELGRAADFASNIISQFGLAAAETGRVGDVLVKTANSANTSVEQLAEALSYAGTMAAKAGIPIEETAAALGVLGDSGIQASRAGTDLRGVIVSLVNPTSEAEDRLHSLGLSLAELDPTANNLLDIFSRLRDANLSLGDATRIFNQRNAAGALAMTSAIDKMRRLSEANRQAGGTAKQLADIQNDTLAGSWRNLKSAAEGAIHSLGELGLKKIFRGVLDTAAGAARAVGDVADALNRVTMETTVLSNVAQRGQQPRGGNWLTDMLNRAAAPNMYWDGKITPLQFREWPFFGLPPNSIGQHDLVETSAWHMLQGARVGLQALPGYARIPGVAGIAGFAPPALNYAAWYGAWSDRLGKLPGLPQPYDGMPGIPGGGPGGLVGATAFGMGAMPEIMRQAEAHMRLIQEIDTTWKSWQATLVDTAGYGFGDVIFGGLTRGAEGFRDALANLISQMAQFSLQMASRIAMLSAFKAFGGADWLNSIGFFSAQQGFSGMLNRPTMFMAHPGEHVEVTPAHHVNAQFHYHGISQHDAMRRTNRQMMGELARRYMG